jgi:hypothetical protein
MHTGMAGVYARVFRKNSTLGTVAENVAGAGLEELVLPETVRSESAVNTSESKRSEISQNCRAEIMSPLL